MTPQEQKAILDKKNAELAQLYAARTPEDIKKWQAENGTIKAKLEKLAPFIRTDSSKGSRNASSYVDVEAYNKKYPNEKITNDDYIKLRGQEGELRYLLDGPQKDAWVSKYGKYVALAAVAAAGAGMVLAAGSAATAGGAAGVASSSGTAAAGTGAAASGTVAAAGGAAGTAGAAATVASTLSTVKDIFSGLSAAGSVVQAVGGLLSANESASDTLDAAMRQQIVAEVNAKSQEAAGEYNAKQLERQASFLEISALDAMNRGAYKAGQTVREGVATNATARASQAGSGTLVDTGTNLDVIVQNAQMAKLNAMTEINNAKREAFGYRVSAEDAKAQAINTREVSKTNAANIRLAGQYGIMDAKDVAGDAKTAGYINAVSSLENGVNSVAKLFDL